MQKITPYLWYDGKAEEAARLYTSIFPDSKIVSLKYWGEGSPFPKDQVMAVIFELNGQRFHAMDAGPQFQFTEAMSLFVDCNSQEEVDHYWNSLTADGGQEQPCGWLKDKFGVSWQIVPRILSEMLQDKDKARTARVMQAMMQMKKIDVATLEKARDEN